MSVDEIEDELGNGNLEKANDRTFFFFFLFSLKNKFITDTLNQTIKDDWDH